AAPEIVPVRDGWAGGNDVWMCGRNWNGGNWNRGNWNGGNWKRGNWNGGNRHGGRHWHGGGYYGCCYGGGYYNDGAAALLGLGLGFGLGTLYGSYNNGYYNNGYYAPRRYYRTVSGAHVRWCYNRYRSYRAWDNTFQ